MPNNTDPAREAAKQIALNEYARTRRHLSASTKYGFEDGYDVGFRDGAASVDRVQVVRTALQNFFEELKWVNGYIGQADLSDAIDAHLEAMEVKNDNQ